MASTADILTDGFGRVREVVHAALDGLSQEQLAWRPDEAANPVGWLVWHLTRVQDDHVADAAGQPQVWLAQGWQERLNLALLPRDTGYGHGPDDVVKVTAGAADLAGYHDAVHEATVAYVQSLSDADLDRVVDEGWDPPVTLAVRLVSVLDDDAQHAGQAAYVRGLLDRSS